LWRRCAYFYPYTTCLIFTTNTMKKTTLLFTCLLLSFKLAAQVTPYTTAASLEANFTGEFITEDFTGGAEEPAICGTVISSAGSDCFDEGVLAEGFALSASNNADMVFLPAGFLPSNNPSPMLGANAGVETTILTFTGDNVFAVGHALYVDSSGDFNYKVYNTNDEIIYNEDVEFSDFYGVVSTTPIGRIEIQSTANGGELIGNLMFGTNTLGLGGSKATQFMYYPNPVNDLLTVQSATAVASLTVVNMLGQVVLQNNANAAINLSTITAGSYVVQATFDNGATEAFRIVKK